MSPLASPQAQQLSLAFAADAELICYTADVFRTRKKKSILYIFRKLYIHHFISENHFNIILPNTPTPSKFSLPS